MAAITRERGMAPPLGFAIRAIYTWDLDSVYIM